MAWARLDDGFGDHPKVLDLIDTMPELEGAAAIGLWTLALTYAHSTMRTAKQPGFIPRSFARSRARVPAYIGDRLVDCGLWEAREGGWFIHDYADYLPSEDLKSKRAEAGKRGAQARWGKNSVRQASDDSVEQTSDEETRPAPDWAGSGRSESGANGRGAGKGSRKPAGADGNLPLFAIGNASVAIDVPSESHAEEGHETAPEGPNSALGSSSDDRPNVTGWQKAQDAMATCHDVDGKKCPEPEPDAIPEPEKVKNTTSSPASPPSGHGNGPSVPKQRQSAEPDRFDEFWNVYPRRVAIGDARKAFTKAVKSGIDADELITAAARFADYCKRSGRPKDKTRHAATWINGESWRDDLDAEEAPPPPPSGHQTYQDPYPNAYYDPKAPR